MMKILIGLLALSFVVSTQAAELKIQKVKTIGDFNHKVIFQSTDVKSVKKSNLVQGKLVAQWGLHVFEVVDAYYVCTAKNVCKLADYETVGMFESCNVKNKAAVCFNKISGDSEFSNSRDLIISENPDAVTTDFGGETSTHGEYYPEFPVRIVDEFSGLF